MTRAHAALWCKSNYSFLEGASHPDELVEEAQRLGIPGLAITDRDGVQGVVRAHLKAGERGVPLVIGSEITVEDGSTIVLLVRDRAGYANLCRLVTRGRLRHEKGTCTVAWEVICAHAGGSASTMSASDITARRSRPYRLTKPALILPPWR